MYSLGLSFKDPAARLLFLPPTRRDAEVIVPILASAGLRCTVCQSANAVALELEKPAGAILLTDSAFSDPTIGPLWRALEQQPAWSEIPSIVLCHTGSQSAAVGRSVDKLRNVTVLEKPTSSRTLISTIQSALRSRARQYQMRNQLDALQTSEAALQSASQALLDSNRRKDEFLAMLAHELRNPLAPIMNAAEIMARKTTEPVIQQSVQLLKRQAKHLTRLVDDLLDLSRITAGRIELRRAPVEVAAVIDQAREIVEKMMHDKRYRLSMTLAMQPLYVNGDHARLVQSIANILNNAAKYTDAGGEISLSTSEERGQIVIEIKDSGIGIAPEFLPRVFDLFVQADRSLDRSQGGLGIGLCVVKRLIEMHGGDVEADSPGLGRGSLFRIRLPLIDSPLLVKPSRDRRTHTSRRILVVDDNVDAANSMADLLRLEGHQAETAHTAKSAIETAMLNQPDVIVLDIGLPDMSGYDVAIRLRPLLKGVRIIALSGYGQQEDLRRSEAAGFDAHLIKPVDFDALSEHIQGVASAETISG